jgi:hypothetical protein
LSAAEVAAPSALVAALSDRARWSFLRTDAWRFGDRVVDPQRLLFEVDGRIEHVLIAEDMGPPGPPQPRTIFALHSEDGLHFNWSGVISEGDLSTDPDCFPLGWAGSWPALLPADWLPGGSGEWGCLLSGASEVSLVEGHLGRLMARTERGISGISVTATTWNAGKLAVWGHERVSVDRAAVSQAIVAYGDPGDVLSVGPVELAVSPRELLDFHAGVFAPNLLELPGADLLVYFTQIEVPVAP